jgi:hypothetical protein
LGRGHDGQDRHLQFGLSHDMVGFGIEIDSGLKVEVALEVGIFLEAKAVIGDGFHSRGISRNFSQIFLRRFHLGFQLNEARKETEVACCIA